MTLTEQVEKKIITNIKSGNFPPGKKLPTLKQLCLLCGVSEITIRNAIKNLQQGDVLIVRQGSGIYVKDWKTTPDVTIGIFNSDMERLQARGAAEDPYFTIMDELIVKHNKQKKYGYNLLISAEKTEKSAFQKLKLDAAIFIKQDFDSEAANICDELEIPYVIAGGVSNTKIDYNFVDYDQGKIINDSIGRLVAAGHRQIACILKKSYNTAIQKLREQSFYESMLRHGLEIAPELLSVIDNNIPASAAFEELIRSRKEITAIYCYGPSEAESLYKYLQIKKIRVPQDISIVSYGFNEFVPNPHNISGYYSDLNKYADTLLEYIRRQLTRNGKLDRTIILEPEWHEGKTVSAPIKTGT
ncbi:MAG: GntR family transcriptional regulator [Victivallales bacterium]|jgi:DNA-binding LacI/PurR family transcriptional regulator